MTSLLQRILIKAPAQVIWELLGDLSATGKWHANCSQVTVLTTQHSGPGTRFRKAMQRGPDVVAEVLTWYDNLGYEYQVIDGPYTSNRGRIRLQMIPEGTIVQWTFEYAYRGFGGPLRNRFHRRRLDVEMAKSLKMLKRLVESSGAGMDAATRERVTIKPAPDAKARAELAANIARTQPSMSAVPQDTVVKAPPPLPPDAPQESAEHTIRRDPPPLPESPPTEPTVKVVGPPPEPAVEEDDTRPNEVLADSLALTQPSIPVYDAAAEESESLPPEGDTLSTVGDDKKLDLESDDVTRDHRTGIPQDALSVMLDDDYEEPPTEPKKPEGLAEAISELQTTEGPAAGGVTTEPDLSALAEPIPQEQTTEPDLTDEADAIIEEVESVSTPPESIAETEVALPTLLEETEAADEDSPTEPKKPEELAAALGGEPLPPEPETSPAAEDDTPAAATRVSQPAGDAPPPTPTPSGPSLLDQKLEPIGPSIWEVFGMDRPGEDDTPSEPDTEDETPQEAEGKVRPAHKGPDFTASARLPHRARHGVGLRKQRRTSRLPSRR